MKYYNSSVNDVLKELNVKKQGLSDEEARKRLNLYGKNELPQGKKDSLFKLFFSQFKNPMELILVVTVILSFIIGEKVDAIALIIIILVDVIIGTIEEWKALKSAESLINMIKVRARVIREGIDKEIDANQIVVGDIIYLESGMKISADARIISSSNLTVDESSLTGESIGVNKSSDIIEGEVSLSERKNMVYAGTSILSGRAEAVVTSIGINTEIGKIADKVNNTEEEKSPLTIRIEKFSKQISILILLVAIITFFVLYIKGYQTDKILLSVIALAVSAMPEGLSLALTMALTVASNRMARKNVITKKLNAVESLGSCTVIASDKTGTLTVNEQTAREIVLKDNSRFLISGTGYNATGEVTPVGGANLADAEHLAFLSSINNEANLEYIDNKWVSFGDSIDIAFLSLAKKLKVNKPVKILNKIPYESENQYSAVFYEKDGETYCTVKGSLEKVMSFSEENELYKKQNIELTSKGYRVIAVCDGKVKGTTLKDIKNLSFVGMVSFIDPIRKEVKDSIKECEEAGIKVVMVTGDHPLTAFAIAKELGLCKNKNEVATGDDIKKYRDLGEEAFDNYVKNIRVFARVTPIDKLDIVNSYKRQGEFIAVTGDGVNDAPAIKAANIGIAMGSGTDVAKETASMIITDDNFTSIVSGIKEGRTAYNNIRKITLFLLGCGLSEVLFFLLSIAFGYDVPLLAIQLLWLNLVTDGLQDIALSFENTEPSIMKEKPRSTKESLFSKDLIIEVSILGLTISSLVFLVWTNLINRGVDITYARSVIMMLMVFVQNLNVLNCRSEKKSIFKTSILSNPFIFITIASSIIIQIIASEVNIFSKFLNVTPLPIMSIFKILLLSFVVIIVYEIYKLIYNIRNKKE